MLATLAGISACGEDDANAPVVPHGAVAVVGERPVPVAALRARVAALDRGLRDARDPDEDSGDLRDEALTTLLEQVWLERETSRRDIRVTRAETAEQVAVARRRFPTPAAYRRFLGRLTERDLRDQLRMQLLYERLADRIAGVPGTQQLSDWLRRRWSRRTVCAAAYAQVAGCGKGVAW